ncbi:hypothetical protein [Sandarakinorhabdus sp. AAP62]|uniref:hypothetical protein n=1 Tax=Sandarakinorhabdus sp. AAP62 TaxID=1248916 RepID=UPI00031BA405|nr:hypothetical protein [Sandarakinorhabdus sp. AAP62]
MMTIAPLTTLAARLLAPRRAPAAPCPPQDAGPTDDWAASVLQSIRCELPLMESIMRMM